VRLSCTSPSSRSRSAAAGLGPGPFLGGLGHLGGGQRDRGVPGEQLEQLGVVRPEDPALVAAEHDADPDDAPAPLQRHADHAA